MIENIMEMCKEKFLYNQEKYENSRRKIIDFYFDEFCLIEGFGDFSYELGGILDSFIIGKEKPYLQFALLRIHEKAIKLYREATIMMENGSASGAMARWRNLYELSIVSKILCKYPDLSIKYIDYYKVDKYKTLKKQFEYKKRLNLIKFDMKAYHKIEQDYKEVCKKYCWSGKSYEWAKNNEIKELTLYRLAKNVEMEHFYAYVDESHMYNHPSAWYLINDRGAKSTVKGDYNNYLFSPFEMELPMQLIVITLYEINIDISKAYSVLDTADIVKLSMFIEQNGVFPKTMIEQIEKRAESTNIIF